MNTLKKLNRIAESTQTNTKMAILEEYKFCPVMKKVCLMAYETDLIYQIKKRIPVTRTNQPLKNLSWALDFVKDNICTRKITGNAMREALVTLHSSLTRDDSEVLWRVMEKDLRIGLGKVSIFKTWQSEGVKPEVMLVGSDISTIKYPAFSQTKMDGCRMIYTKDKQALTRNGKVIPLKGTPLGSELETLPKNQYDGELLIRYRNKYRQRQTSNGLINALIKSGAVPDGNDLVYVVWDRVTTTNTKETYEERFAKLKSIVAGKQYIKLVDTQIVANYQEVREHYDQQRVKGEEGTIVKNFDGLFEAKRSKSMCKLKSEMTAEFEVVGWEEGTGKNTGKLGALKIATSCYNLLCNVGTGFSDADRESLTPENSIGKIVEVKFNTIIQGKKKEPSLFLPRFIRFRFDKENANSLEEVEIQHVQS